MKKILFLMVFAINFISATNNTTSSSTPPSNPYKDVLFAHAKFAGTIKDELLKTAESFKEQLKKKGTINKKFKPEQVPQAKEPDSNQPFKYCQSILHLAISLKGKIALVPEPEKLQDLILTTENLPWFWNDGTYTKNKETYEVKFHDKSYTSTYNTIKKEWECDDNNKMSYLTYYEYLVEKNHSRNTFVRHLVEEEMKPNGTFDKMLPYYKFGKNYKLGKENYAKNKKLYIAFFTQIILEEENHPGSYTFYSAYDTSFELAYDFITILYNYLNIEGGRRERIRPEDQFLYTSVEDFFKKNPLEDPLIAQWTDGSGDNRTATLMSCNIFLFGNDDAEVENSLAFFLSNLSVHSNWIFEIIQKLCKENNLTEPSKQTFENLYNEYQKIGGKLRQIFIPPQAANTISYLSMAFGVPFFARNIYPKFFSATSCIRCLTNYLTQENNPTSQNPKPDYQLLTTTRVLNLLRTHPENPCFQLNGLGDIQARLIHSHELFFDPKASQKAGIKTIYYFADPDGEKKQIAARKKLETYIRDNLFNALETGKKSSPEIGEKNPLKEKRLWSLYKAMQPVSTTEG